MSMLRVEPAGPGRAVFRGLAVVGLAACVVLTGCAPGGSASPARTAHSERPADWRDATYTMTCDGVVPGGFRVTLHNGAARVPADVGQPQDYDYFDVRFEAEASGDVDGDGALDTVVLLQCSPQPSNGIVEEAQVFSAADGRLGVLPSPRTLRQESILPPVYDPTGLSVDHGDVVAAMKAYGPEDSHASGPSEQMTVRWHWNGQGFVRVP